MTFEPAILLRLGAEIIGWLTFAYWLILGFRLWLRNLMKSHRTAWEESKVF